MKITVYKFPIEVTRVTGVSNGGLTYEGKAIEIEEPKPPRATDKVTVCIEAYWSGYNSSQERCVHREYRKVSRAKAEEWSKSYKQHRFTDGTYNYYKVKILKPREKKEREIKGYIEITNNLFK